MPNRQMSVYVDGYNLYCGALEHTNRKWLDLVGLFRRIRSGDDLIGVRYFTSLDDQTADPARAARQAEYIRALETFAPLLSVHLGKRKKSGVVCGVAKNVCQVARKRLSEQTRSTTRARSSPLKCPSASAETCS